MVGRGATAQIFLVEDKISKRKLALKHIEKSKLDSQDETQIANEVSSLRKVTSPFVVSFYSTIQTPDSYYHVMEFAERGDLRAKLEYQGRLPEKACVRLAAGILLGLEHIHSLGITHCDLKPENVLITINGDPLLCDFGCSRQDDSAGSWQGTSEYMPPEAIRGELDRIGKHAADFWAFGVLLYELLNGRTPFTACNNYQIIKNVLKGEVTRTEHMSESAFCLVRHLLERDATKRLGNQVGSINRIKQHPFFREVRWQKLEGKKMRFSKYSFATRAAKTSRNFLEAEAGCAQFKQATNCLFIQNF